MLAALRMLDRHPRWFAGLLIIHTIILFSILLGLLWFAR
jgi:hypothetical protein